MFIGFRENAQMLNITALLDDFKSLPHRLVLVGHSLGGSTAENVFDLLVHGSKNFPPNRVKDVAVYTFGAPLAFDVGYAQNHESDEARIINFVNENDGVPRIFLPGSKVKKLLDEFTTNPITLSPFGRYYELPAKGGVRHIPDLNEWAANIKPLDDIAFLKKYKIWKEVRPFRPLRRCSLLSARLREVPESSHRSHTHLRCSSQKSPDADH